MDNDREVSSLFFVSPVQLKFDAIGLPFLQIHLTEIYFASLCGRGTLRPSAKVAATVVGDVVIFYATLRICCKLSFA